MAQPALFILSGHAPPIQVGDIKQVPPNGQMIRMIPGTCPPVHAIGHANSSLLKNPNQSAQDIVQLLNDVRSEKVNAFHLYDSSDPYSDLFIDIVAPSVAEGNDSGSLKEYKRKARHVEVTDVYELLKPLRTVKPDGAFYVKLSDVHKAISDRHGSGSYMLIVIACVLLENPKLNAAIQHELKSASVPIVEMVERLKKTGYAGGKKSRMNKRAMGKKRRDRKKTQRKKTHAKRRWYNS